MLSKYKLREEIAELKKGYSETELKKLSENVFTNLESTQAFVDSKCILAYYSFPGEVFTHDFIAKHAKEKTIILPVVRKDMLVLKEFKGSKAMMKSSYGILEPTGYEFTDYSKIDLAIIPGVGFDRQLNRLGRGKAYYDRLLPRLSAYFIGVCFSFQLKEKIPIESHDLPMDCVISENEIINLRL